jgi:hypothetical protein
VRRGRRSQGRRVPRIGLAILLGLAVAPAASAAEPTDAAADREVVDMSPEDGVGWSMRNVFAPITSIFLGGPSYWYSKRELDVETTPPGGFVDLFYVRANFQKRFEQAETPVTVLLPPRIEAGPRDSLTIRAFREGYRQQSISLKMSDRRDRVVIELDPLPNRLEAFSHRYFAGRSTLSFLTKELPEFRLQEAEDGFTVVLNETAKSPEAAAAIEGVRSPIAAEAFAQQLGEDLLVTVNLTPEYRKAVELRSRQTRDAARDLYEFSVDLAPKDGGARSVQRAIDALARIRTDDVTGCALRFDETLRSRLDPGALSRALVPQGSFTDRYLRAAMRRLGEVTPGNRVSFQSGERYDPTVPIELEAALIQAPGAQGYLALLHEFVAEMEPEAYRSEALRSLVAPELDAKSFSEDLAAAERAERECRSSSL